jgi:hypothetical protein
MAPSETEINNKFEFHLVFFYYYHLLIAFNQSLLLLCVLTTTTAICICSNLVHLILGSSILYVKLINFHYITDKQCLEVIKEELQLAQWKKGLGFRGWSLYRYL